MRRTSRSRFARLVAFALALLVLVACDSGPKEGEEALYYGEQLRHKDPKKRDAALRHLVRLKDKRSLPALHEALLGEDVELKPEIASLVALLGDETSVDPLLRAIDWKAGAGRDKKTRAAATTNERIAKALGRVAKPGDEKAIEALRRLATSNHLNAQLEAVVALGRLRAQSAVEELIEIADGHENNYMVKNAIIALGEIANEKAIPVVVKLLFFERGVSFYRESSYALFQIGRPAIDALLEVYHGRSEPVRALHVDLGVQRAKAIEVLGDIGDRRLRQLLLDSANVAAVDTATVLTRAKAHAAVGRLGVREAIPILMRHWDDVDVSKSEFAVQALAQLGAREALPGLVGMTTHDGFMRQCVQEQRNAEHQCRFSAHQVRRVRLMALSQLATGRELAVWEKMIEDADKNAAEEDQKIASAGDATQKRVAEEAKKGHEKTKALLVERKPMLEAAKECGATVDCWIGKLKDENPRVREKAGYELLYAGDDKAVPALLEAVGDQDNEVRYPAILALWRRLPTGDAAKKAVERLDQILEDEHGKTQFVRINEDVKRLRVKLARGY